MADLTDWDLFSSYGGLLSLACFSIYIGAYGSITIPKGLKSPQDDEDDEDEVPERISSGDAWLFPVIGSITLLGLYLIIKYLGKEWINFILGWYFSITGVLSVWKSSISFARYLIGTPRWRQFTKSSFNLGLGSISLRTPSILLFPLAIVPSGLYTFSSVSRKSVLITDILGMSFSHNALALLKLDSFKTGCILLSGLFFYDIWWVFGTPVMVEVATKLDVPIKLLWPKSMSFSDSRGFTMLGLGDIVVPGCFITLALRYDFYRACRLSKTVPTYFSKPYFSAALAAYFSGLLITMSVMHFFAKAQPALLYLSPACMLSFFITALMHKDFAEAWAWSDDPEVQAQTPQDTKTDGVEEDGEREHVDHVKKE